MRSRYAAFALHNAAYLSATWHPSTRPAHIDFNPGQVWMLLKVLEANEEGDRATVEFTARSRIGGSSHLLHEVSRFVREGGQWFYVDGVIR
jgi:SEC-C motif-containing protein